MSGSSSVPYSPKCLEEEFSEVHRSKQLLYAPPSPHQQAPRTPRASERGDYVVFVTPLCIKGLRLVTA
jgi:hypothetical protein